MSSRGLGGCGRCGQKDCDRGCVPTEATDAWGLAKWAGKGSVAAMIRARRKELEETLNDCA
jgi:hypothetical protein